MKFATKKAAPKVAPKETSVKNAAVKKAAAPPKAATKKTSVKNAAVKKAAAPMKQFFAFYNSGFDSELQAQTYVDEASVHASAIRKVVDSAIVDVTTNDPAKKFWNTPNTILCVTVDNGALKESRLNPSALADIDRMIDRL